MEKERRKFSREFKLKAVELSYLRANIKELARELDVRPELIYRWRTSSLQTIKEQVFLAMEKSI